MERKYRIYYRIKRFFSGVHACVHGADALTNCISDVYSICECIGTEDTCMNSLKEALNPYNSSMWMFSLLLSFFIETLTITTWSLHSRVVYRGVIYLQVTQLTNKMAVSQNLCVHGKYKNNKILAITRILFKGKEHILVIIWSHCRHDFFLRILSAPFWKMVMFWLMKLVANRIISWIWK